MLQAKWQSTGRGLALALVSALASGAASAQDVVPKPLSREWANDPPRVEASCAVQDLRFSGAPLFRIDATNAARRVYFRTTKQLCRAAVGCGRQRAGYLVTGDIVFAGPEDRGFRCVAFGPRRGDMVGGFIPNENLVAVEAETTLDRAFLVGTWRRDAASSIRIRANAGGIEAEGEGHWKGMQSVNVGAFKAKAAIASPLLLLREEDEGCIVVLERRGPYLLANDNSRCGGNNVRFVGIYLKQAAR